MDNLSTFLSRAGDKPYRNYSARIVQNVGVDYIAGMHQTELGRAEKHFGIGAGELSSRVAPAYDRFVDHMRHKPPEFWERFSCRDAIVVIREEAGRVEFGLPGQVLSEEAGENLIDTYFGAFSFQFAEDAHASKVIRRAMGIKKGLFRQ